MPFAARTGSSAASTLPCGRALCVHRPSIRTRSALLPEITVERVLFEHRREQGLRGEGQLRVARSRQRGAPTPVPRRMAGPDAGEGSSSVPSALVCDRRRSRAPHLGGQLGRGARRIELLSAWHFSTTSESRCLPLTAATASSQARSRTGAPRSSGSATFSTSRAISNPHGRPAQPPPPRCGATCRSSSYDSGDSLDAAHDAGFESVGELVVWVNAATPPPR